MADPLLSQLHAGSFRGAKFLVTDASTTGGRKQVKHSYPNSSKQAIEDLGFKPRNFKITAIITGPNTDDPRSYLEKRDALLEALELPGNGTLSHPFFFASLQVVAKPYTLNEKTSELERGRIEMEFDISDVLTNPIPDSTSVAQINEKVGAVTDSLGENLEEGWGTSSGFNLENAREILGDFSDFAQTTTRTIFQVQNQINAFNAQVADFAADINTIASIPARVSEAVMGIVQTIGGLYSTQKQAFAVFKRFFEFGDDTPDIPPTTPQRTERQRNNQLLKHAIQGAFLAMAYQSAAQQDYTTINDIDAVQGDLEAQFKKLSNDGLDTDTMYLLSDLRALAGQFLEAERLNAARLITIKASRYPISVIAYQYYGPTPNLVELTNALVDLNRPVSDNPSFVSGEIDIVTT